MPNGPMRITSGPFEPDLYKSEMEIQDAELKVSVEWNMNMGHLWTSWKDFQSTALYDPTLLRTPASVFQALLQSSASRTTQKKKKKKDKLILLSNGHNLVYSQSYWHISMIQLAGNRNNLAGRETCTVAQGLPLRRGRMMLIWSRGKSREASTRSISWRWWLDRAT